MSKYSQIAREGSLVHLSAHAGDGVFGNVVYVRASDIDNLYKHFVERGLKTDRQRLVTCVIMEPVEQTWRMKEFSVRDPDGNRLTFGQSMI